MNITEVVLIGLAIVIIIILWRVLKPYIIKYDTTVFITGELGSGKTLTAVKIAITQIRKARLRISILNFFRKIANKYRTIKNTRNNKKSLKSSKNRIYKHYEIKPLHEKPLLFSNIPIHYKTHLFRSSREWSCKITKEMLTLYEKVPEYSVILVDELPQLVNQFNWDIEEVKNNINEYITFFRHYIGGHFIITAQATNDVVVQIRRKCNQAIWCYNMKKYFRLFYSIQMADMILNDNIQNMSTTYIEDNTKKNWGFFPKKGTYDTRCFSERYKNTLLQPNEYSKWDKIKTNEIIRMEKYQSPLDDSTTEEQKKKGYNKIHNL